MSALPIAHAGHWITGLLYLAPLVVVVGMLAISSIRDRRAEAAELADGGGPQAPDSKPEDPSAA